MQSHNNGKLLSCLWFLLEYNRIQEKKVVRGCLTPIFFSFLTMLCTLFVSHGGTFIKRKNNIKQPRLILLNPRTLAEKKCVMKKAVSAISVGLKCETRYNGCRQ